MHFFQTNEFGFKTSIASIQIVITMCIAKPAGMQQTDLKVI